MNIYRLAQLAISFNDKMLDSYSGQTNMRLQAIYEDSMIGWIDYVIFRDEVSVSNIEVKPEFQRKKVATSLLKKLQTMYPQQEIQMGMFTTPGHALWESMDKNVVHNKQYQDLQSEQRDLENVQRQMISVLESLPPRDQRTQEQQQLVVDYGDRFNAISDRMWEIEQHIKDMRPSQTFIM